MVEVFGEDVLASSTVKGRTTQGSTKKKNGQVMPLDQALVNEIEGKYT